MGIAFPRSIRALGNDRFRPSLVTLTITSVLLLAWFMWFFFAQIPTNASSTNFQIARNGSVTATFPATMMPRLKAGQKALLQLTQINSSYEGEILNAPSSATNTSTIELYFPNLAQVPANAQGTIQIEIANTTPAMLVLQAVRQSAAALNSPPPSPTTKPTP